MKPRVAFQVPNTLTGEGNLRVDITFESMDDFSPAAVARKVERAEASCSRRAQQLANLITYMDGKTGAEELIAKVLKDPALLKTLAAAPKPTTPKQQTPTHRGDADHGRSKQSARAQPLQRHRVPGQRVRRRCCKKEFKPKTDDAKTAVEQAVRTLAQQALAQTQR